MLSNDYSNIDLYTSVLKEIREIFRQDFFGDTEDWDSDDKETQEATIEGFFFKRIAFRQAEKSCTLRYINFHNVENDMIEDKLIKLFIDRFRLSVTHSDAREHLLSWYREVTDAVRLHKWNEVSKLARKRHNEELVDYNVAEMINAEDEKRRKYAESLSKATEDELEAFFQWYWSYNERGVFFSPEDWIKWKDMKASMI